MTTHETNLEPERDPDEEPLGEPFSSSICSLSGRVRQVSGRVIGDERITNYQSYP